MKFIIILVVAIISLTVALKMLSKNKHEKAIRNGSAIEVLITERNGSGKTHSNNKKKYRIITVSHKGKTHRIQVSIKDYISLKIGQTLDAVEYEDEVYLKNYVFY